MDNSYVNYTIDTVTVDNPTLCTQFFQELDTTAGIRQS